jgi:hypothetical protein
MRNFRLIVSIGMAAASAALAGCSADMQRLGIGLPGAQPVPAASVPASKVSRIKQLVLKGCQYEATFESIAAVLVASPAVPAIGAVAAAICNAVTTLPLADGPGDRRPRVNGVVVEGQFVRR